MSTCKHVRLHHKTSAVLQTYQVFDTGEVVFQKSSGRSIDQLSDGGCLNARVKMMPALGPATELYVNLNVKHWVLRNHSSK